MISDSDFNSVAQKAHACLGALIPVLFMFLFGPKALLWSCPVFLAWAAWKEFYYDANYETPDVRGSDLEDFLFYCLGVFLGLLTCAFKYWVLR